MNIVVLLPWIALSALVVPAVTVATGPRCDANHTRLLLLVDLSPDTNLTITRLKNIVSYFITKVKDGIIKTMDVCLVDPFQEKTLFNLTNVNSSQEITSATDQLVQSNVSANQYERSSINKIGVEASLYFINDLFNNLVVEHKEYVVVILLHCQIDCLFHLAGLHDIFISFKQILSIALLNSHSEINSKTYNIYYQNDYGTDKQSYLIVDNDDDFTTYNPVAVYACRECPQGWIRYSHTVNTRLSCYSVDKMDASMSWTQASNLCESIKSNLPMFETEDELMFLRDYLRQTKVATTADLNVSIATSAVVHTGLMLKQHWPKKTTFIWMNLRPFSPYLNVAKIDDYRQTCVALNLTLQKITGKDDFIWILFSCDKHITKLLACEMEVNLIEDKDKMMAALQATSQICPRRKMFSHSHNEPITWDAESKDIYLNRNINALTYFKCRDGVISITYNLVCDGFRDCQNGRDEQYCNRLSKDVQLGEFYCENPNRVNGYPSRVSVSLEARCDGIQDCPDRSDEKGCDGCLGRQCEDGTCLPSHWLSRDFEACNLFIGANRTAYINVSYSCQDHWSGLIQSDHEISFCNRNIKVEEYSEGELLYSSWTSKIEWAPKCLYLRGSGERPTGCHDEYQLRDCTTFQCPEGFIKCINSYCVPVYNVRDGVFDCLFGEDEELVVNISDVNGIFKCLIPFYDLETYIYVHQLHICDGVPQCPKGEDENDCQMTCPTGFNCNAGAVVVINYTLVQEIKSLNIFDAKIKCLNISGIDLSKLNETFMFPNLLEIHASNCNLLNLEKIFNTSYEIRHIYTASFSYNKLKSVSKFGPLSTLINLQFLDLSHNENLTEFEEGSIHSSKLHTLDLSFTGISVLTLYSKHMESSLRSLNLGNTKVAHMENFELPVYIEFLNMDNIPLVEQDITSLLRLRYFRSALYVNSYKYCCPQISTGGTPRHACHAPPEAFSSCEDLLSDLLKRSLLWLVAIVSLAGNIVVITYRLFFDRGVFKKGYGIFVTNLSVSDFIMGVYLLIIASTDVRYRDEYVLHESSWRNSALCKAAGFLSTVSSETSTFFVFLITLDRCLVIKFPFGDHRFTKLGLVISVLAVWILGFMFALVPLMYPEWIIYSSNGMCLGLPLTIGRHPGWHYSFSIFICVNFILFLCNAFGQIFIFSLISSSHSFQMTNAQSVARRLQDIKVAKQLFFVVLSNFICWFPICVLGFLSMTGYEVSPDTYAWLVVFVMPLNAAVNPIIYTIPFMYSKWQDFRKGENTRTRWRVNKPATPETKM